MENLKVSDCMSRKFVSFTPEMPVVEAAMNLVQNELIGGPVVNGEGALIGWISEQDCLGTVSQVMYYADRAATVSDIMRKEVLAAKTDDNLLDLASMMQQHKPKIYPVVDERQRVMGVISRRIILREMCKQISRPR
ncbi:CBS domain-containing protein [Hahella ganghwensis]|uniref:CBS domain-containing protein n=1 Tax=Hahella ganghwensis TaxID=286420 RepID=UPI00036088FF|nr:CBS domain-containing protein [Hahella ganghwensis]